MGTEVNYKTEQESFWAGTFGDQYIERNQGKDLLASNIALFARVFARTGPLRSVVELGANIGMNLRAIRELMPDIKVEAVEINRKAAQQLDVLKFVKVHHESLLNFKTDQPADLSFTKGVLIHINPSELDLAYKSLYGASSRYILLCEYYSTEPVEMTYRGYSDRLFKRDFAGEMLDKFPDLRLLDYGFIWNRETFAQEDCNWFLLQKSSS
jgi:spore coat polysaccharide biosynthesis protein SpsF